MAELREMAPVKPKLSTPVQEQFLLAEYQALRAEILSAMAEIKTLEVSAVAAVAAILAWFSTAHVPSHNIWYVPGGIPILGALRSWAINYQVGRIGGYIRSIEALLLDKTGHDAWESTLQPVGKRRKRLMIRMTVYVFGSR